MLSINNYICSVAEWLKRRAGGQHDHASKPTRAVVLCSWERHSVALSSAWQSW